MQAEYRLLIDLIRSQLSGTPVTLPEELDIQAFMDACQAHRLEPFAFLGLQGQTDFPAEHMKILEAAYSRALFRDTQFDYHRQQLARILTEKEIPHVFLRGICLKQDYPIPALRTMSDMDILVYPESFPLIRQSMEQLGAQFRECDGNHRTYWFADSRVEIEFHPNLIHVASPVATGANPGWQYVPAGQQEMTPEGFYVSVLAHLASHFASGGAGIRFVLDIWVCRHLRKAQPDRQGLEQELSRIGLLDFARQIETLAEHWFSGVPGELEELENYIFTSGSHGIPERAMFNAAALAGSSTKALWKKAFYPRQELETRFDWAAGRPWLLPAAWLVRSFRAVTRRGNLIHQWQQGTASHRQEEIIAQKDRLKRFGIQSKDHTDKQ